MKYKQFTCCKDSKMKDFPVTISGRNRCVNLKHMVLNSNSLIHSTFKCFLSASNFTKH